MSLCDKCYAPGHCCRSMEILSGGKPLPIPDDGGEDAALAMVRDRNLPWCPIRCAERAADADGKMWARWFFACEALGPDGRCTIYESRPDICRRYEAGSDWLCAMYPGESGDGSAPYAMGWDREYEGVA